MNSIPNSNKHKNGRQYASEILEGKSFRQLVRYGLVGLGINAALYSCFLLFVFFGVEPKIAMSIVYVIGLGVGFYGHRKLTFSHTENCRRAIGRFLVAHIGGYAINFFLLVVFVDHMHLSHALIQGLSILIVAAYLFIAFKYWAFSEKNYATS
jgi:putative flippase GtrA